MFVRCTGGSWGGRVDGYCDRLIWSWHILNVRIAYSETSIWTVYHYEKVLKASDIVWFVSTSAVIWSSVACVASVSTRVRRESWDDSKKKKKRKDGGGERREQSKLFRSGILGAFSRIVGFAGKRFLFSPPPSIFFTPALTFVLYLDWERSLRTLGLVCWFQWLEWSYCGLFFRMYNIDLKCSFVRCRKYHKLWWNGAAEFHISVDLLYGTTAAGTFERWTLWKIQQTEIDSTPLANSWNMYALRRFSKLSKDERFTKTE